jgi:xylulokinase
VCQANREVLEKAGVAPREVAGIAFAGQMLSLVPLDASGQPTRPAISWLDGRAGEEARAVSRLFGGERVVAWVAGGAPTGKDIVPKVRWLQRHERETLARTAALCDATGYLVGRATGTLRMDPTAAGATGLFSPASRRWRRHVARWLGFPLSLMPEVVPSTEVVAGLRPEAASALGLIPGTPVAMGMADIPAAAVGSGALSDGEGHVYLGTSAWIAVTSTAPRAVPRAGIAAVPSADVSGCLVIGESETAGACRDWLASLLGGAEERREEDAAAAPPGSGGLLFAPWLYGERSPAPDAGLRGAFVGLGLGHHRGHLARAVYEGVACNLSWILEELAGVGLPCPTLRAIGGGAQGELWLQILADATGRRVDRVKAPLHAGAVGAALVAVVAIGAAPGLKAVKELVPVERSFTPRPDLAPIYRRRLRALKALRPALGGLRRLLEEQ